MATVFVRWVPTNVKSSLNRMAKAKQKTRKPNLNQYVNDLFERHTARERQQFKNGKG